MQTDIKYVLYKKDLSSMDYIFSVLEETDIDFTPKLSDKYNLKELSEKFAKLGNCLICFVDSLPAGLVVFYPNKKPLDSYLSVICVKERFRGQSIGKTLEEKCINECKEYNSKGLSLNMRKSNKRLLNSRIKMGYKIQKEYENASSHETIVDLYLNFN